jgi:hypothetical protein
MNVMDKTVRLLDVVWAIVVTSVVLFAAVVLFRYLS